MVALTKKHFIGLLLGALVLALLAVGVRIALSSRMHRPPPPVQHPVEDEIPGHPTPEKFGPVASVHPNFNVPASRIQELKKIFANVAEAYTNGQFEVARRRPRRRKGGREQQGHLHHNADGSDKESDPCTGVVPEGEGVPS